MGSNPILSAIYASHIGSNRPIASRKNRGIIRGIDFLREGIVAKIKKLLSDIAIKNAKDYKLSDSGSLYILIKTNGSTLLLTKDHAS